MDLTQLEQRLLENAFLFDEPITYAAGVRDALDAVERMMRWRETSTEDALVLDEPVAVASGA